MPNQVDIDKRCNNKSRHLEYWVTAQDGGMSQVVAFGDNHNNLIMVESAGFGVTIGQRDDAIKARADVVISDNEATSIAYFIRQHLLA